jgi:hypothetical protein
MPVPDNSHMIGMLGKPPEIARDTCGQQQCAHCVEICLELFSYYSCYNEGYRR